KRLNQGGLWQKMFLDSLIGKTEICSSKYKKTWKMKSTKFFLYYFQLKVSVTNTSEKGFGLLPTPTAWEGRMYKMNIEAAQRIIQTQKGIGRKLNKGRKKQMCWIHHAILFYN